MWDIGIRAGFLVSMNPKVPKVQKDFFVGVKKNKIDKIEAWKNQNSQCQKFIDASNHVIMPGLVNGHTHLPMSLFRGLADDLPFQEWLFKNIFPVEAKLVSSQFVKTGMELSALELIGFGVTTCFDMYYFTSTVADVMDKAGLRGILAQPMVDFKTPDSPNPQNTFELAKQLVEKLKGHSRLKAAIGPHAPYTCGDDTLKLALKASQTWNLPMAIHVSETAHEVKESIEKFGKSPVERLHQLGISGAHVSYAHGVHLSEKDIELILKSKTSIIHNPESNMKLGAGTAPIVNYLKAGIPIGLGTDGAASNNNLNMFVEMDFAAKQQKLTFHDNAAITAYQVLKLATLDGAKAIGLGSEIGSLEEGKLADIICVDFDFPHLQPIHDPISNLVYATSGQEVSHVICDGKILMENREIKLLNKDQIFEEANSWTCKMDEAVG